MQLLSERRRHKKSSYGVQSLDPIQFTFARATVCHQEYQSTYSSTVLVGNTRTKPTSMEEYRSRYADAFLQRCREIRAAEEGVVVILIRNPRQQRTCASGCPVPPDTGVPPAVGRTTIMRIVWVATTTVTETTGTGASPYLRRGCLHPPTTRCHPLRSPDWPTNDGWRT